MKAPKYRETARYHYLFTILHPVVFATLGFINERLCMLFHPLKNIPYNRPARLLRYDCGVISGPTTYWDASCYGTQPLIFPYPVLKKGILITLSLI